MPPVVGQTLEQATQRLDRAGLGVEVKRRADQAPRDFVFEQSPNPGQKVDKDSIVTLFVSNGPTTVKVPDVVGLSERRTRAGACAAPICAPTIERESSTKVPEGTVIRTDPGPGPPDRARLVGDAVRQLRARARWWCRTSSARTRRARSRGCATEGLSPIVRERSSSEPVDTVVDQSPAAGQRVDEGSTVTIFVSNGKVREVPDVTGLTQGEAEAELRGRGLQRQRAHARDRPARRGRHGAVAVAARRRGAPRAARP